LRLFRPSNQTNRKKEKTSIHVETIIESNKVTLKTRTVN
jgi:hypothetical protein